MLSRAKTSEAITNSISFEHICFMARTTYASLVTDSSMKFVTRHQHYWSGYPVSLSFPFIFHLPYINTDFTNHYHLNLTPCVIIGLSLSLTLSTSKPICLPLVSRTINLCTQLNLMSQVQFLFKRPFPELFLIRVVPTSKLLELLWQNFYRLQAPPIAKPTETKH